MHWKKLLLIALFLASSLVYAQTTQAAETDVTVTGHVYEADGTTLLTVDAWVQALTDTGDYYLEHIQADGSYSITMPPGTYHFLAEAHPSHDAQFYPNQQTRSAATRFTLAAGDSLSAIDFSLGLAGVIQGRVTDENDVPLANQVVHTSEDLWIGTCTDVDGYYQLEAVPLNYPVQVLAGGGNNWCGGSGDYLPEYWEESSNDSSATWISLTSPNQISADVNFTLALGIPVTGHVYEADGSTPISENAWVNAVRDDGQQFGTDVQADGSYRLVLAPSSYQFVAQAYEHENEFYPEKRIRNEATVFSLNAGDTLTDIDFSLGYAGMITGRVTDENGNPIANKNITPTEDMWIGACTDAEGYYTLYGIPLNYPLRIVSWDGNWCGGSSDYLTEFWQETADYDSATLISLTSPNQTISDVNFTLTLGAVVTGHIYEADGVTVISDGAGVSGIVTETGEALNSVSVNADGSYRLILPPNTYQFLAHGAGYANEFYPEKPVRGEASQFTLNAGDHLSDIDFTLGLGGMIQGRVTDENGNPIANHPVDILEDIWTGACTDAQGYYTIYSVPLNYPVYLVSWGHSRCGGLTDYTTEYWQEVPRREMATPVTVTDANQAISDVNFTLRVTGSISGIVQASENNSPLADVWLCAFDYSASHFNLGYEWVCAQTQADGTYLLEGVPVGQTRLWIFPDDRLRPFYPNSPTFEGASPVMVTEGVNTPNINFSLAQATIITGYVFAEDGRSPLTVTVSTANGAYMECANDGLYRIYVPLGTHTIQAFNGVCSDQSQFPTQYYRNALSSNTASPLVVNTLGTTISAVDFMRIPYDANRNGIVSPTDSAYVRNRRGGTDVNSDIDFDGDIDNADVQAILVNLGRFLGIPANYYYRPMDSEGCTNASNQLCLEYPDGYLWLIETDSAVCSWSSQSVNRYTADIANLCNGQQYRHLRNTNLVRNP